MEIEGQETVKKNEMIRILSNLYIYRYVFQDNFLTILIIDFIISFSAKSENTNSMKSYTYWNMNLSISVTPMFSEGSTIWSVLKLWNEGIDDKKRNSRRRTKKEKNQNHWNKESFSARVHEN